MDFEPVDNDINYDEVRYKTEIDGKPFFIHITREAWEDDFKEGLTPDKKKKLEKIVKARLASGHLARRLDIVEIPYEAVLIKMGDLA